MSRLVFPRRQFLPAGLLVAGLVVAFVVTPRLRDGVAIAVAVVIAAASVAVLVMPNVRQAHPVIARALLTLVALDATLLLTFFLSATTDFNLAVGAAMSIVLLGLSFLTGASGQISLGNSAFMGVGALVVAMWADHHATTPIVVTILIAVACGAAVGLLLGLPATRLRGPYLAGMTLAFVVAFPALDNLFSSWTGGDAGLELPTPVTSPHWLAGYFSANTSSFTLGTIWMTDMTVIITAVAFFLMANLFASRAGRAMRLIRDNDVAAELVGVSLPRARVLAFIVSAAYAALGGALWTLINNSVSPPTYTLALSITILSLMVIGGIGTIPGAIFGGVIYAYSTNVITWFTSHVGIGSQSNLASQMPGIVFGALLILTMLFAPRGLTGALHRLREWRRDR